MHGVLNVLKPPGMTSHDVVGVVRRATGMKRVGHTGTLDPAAAGVLPICIGHATRLVEYLQAGSKEYIAEATFGYETDTLDAVGRVVSEADAGDVTLDGLRGALDPFRGTIRQTPPLYSAIKQGGRKLYEMARSGVEGAEDSIKVREVTIDRLFVSRFVAATDASRPRAVLHIECGGGTYVRSLVRDIGRALGCGATMTFLVRTRSGAFTIADAFTLEQIQRDAGAAMLPITEVLRWCASHVVVDDEAVQQLAHGRVVAAPSRDHVVFEEYRKGGHQYKQRRTRAWHNNTAPDRILFLNVTETLAALAAPVPSSDPICYKAEKVFYLESPD